MTSDLIMALEAAGVPQGNRPSRQGDASDRAMIALHASTILRVLLERRMAEMGDRDIYDLIMAFREDSTVSRAKAISILSSIGEG